MNEMTSLITDLGITVVFLGGIFYLLFRYTPKALDIWVDRIETRNSSYDLMMETVKNNSATIENNSRVIEQNTQIITEYLKQQSELNKSLKELSEEIRQHDKRAEHIGRAVAVIKDRT